MLAMRASEAAGAPALLDLASSTWISGSAADVGLSYVPH